MTAVPVLRRAIASASERTASERSGLIVTGVFYLMVTSVLSGLWSTAASVNGGSIVGYTATAFVWYVATSEAATISLPQRLIEDTGEDIGSGRVAIEMLRPARVLSLRIADQVGAMLPRLAVCITCGLVFATSVAGLPPSGLALALAAPSLVLALTLNIVAQHAFSAAAFWIRDAKGTWFLYQKLVFILGGMLIPLEVLPSWLERTAKLLPFMAMAYAPARLAAGNVEPWLIAVQLGWLVVLGFIAAKTFAAGERHLVETGG